MTRHTISHADEIFGGAPQAGGINNALRGVRMAFVRQKRLPNVDAGDVDGIAVAQAVAAAGDLTLDGAFVTAGVATISTPRNVVILSDNAGDGSQVATVIGADIVGNLQVEDLTFNGTTEVRGLKAFATVTRIAIDAALAGNASAGTSVTLANIELGLDARLIRLFDVLSATTGASPIAQDGGVFTIGDVTDPPTAITGDPRGTYNPGNLPDGSIDYILYYLPDLTKDAYGQNFTG